MNKTDITSLPFVAKLSCVLISMYLLFYISVIGQSIWVPLFMSFLIATLLLPLSNFLEKKLRFPRIVSSLIAPIFFVFLLLIVFYLLGLQMVQFKNDLPSFKEQILNLFHQGQQFVYDHFGVDQDQQLNYINSGAETTLKKGTSFIGQLVFSFTSIITSLAFIFLYTFFILLYRKHIMKFAIWCFNPIYKAHIKYIGSQIKSIVKQYLIGLSIQVTCIITLLFTAFSIIGINYAFLFAALCGILNLIPYVGIFSGTVLAALVTFATGTPIDALWVIISVIIVNSIDGNIITPKVIGSKVQLNSFLVFFGLIVAESLWGISGMFLAIPILAITKILFDNVYGMEVFGFLLGEENVETPLYDELYNDKPTDLINSLETQEINDDETNSIN